MNVTQLIQAMRDRLDESSANVWTDVELLRYADQAIRTMVRRQADVDESYANMEYTVSSTDLRQPSEVGSDVYVLDTPYWLYRVNELRETQTSATGARNAPVPYRTLHNRAGRFWTFDRLNRLRLVNTGRLNVTMQVTKDPAPLMRATLDTDTFASPTTAVFYVKHTSADPTGVIVEKEKDAYANSIWEITGVDSATRQPSGQRRRVKASETVVNGSGVVYTKLTLDRPFTIQPAASDTLEMVPEVQPVHHEYLILLACKKAWLRKANLQSLEAMKEDLRSEEERFLAGITPRQDQEQPFIGMDKDIRSTFDQDQDNTRSW